ncbi:hypothetical protein MKK84_27965 [Methylobacterium sp. E-065]|uniref:hypothetical protein n=1 Tax=Methylobacterium sp. E-065 TaxID=2836583 RepID=UPI001FB8CEEC|nr:hypothetical protein [Methylobacterium sp. E-065]MCJ2021208.1 hypothetical protein [Methylobacterium sp. E-065]
MPEPTLGGFTPFNEAHAIVSVQATIQFAHPVSEAQWAAMRSVIWQTGRDLGVGHPTPAFGLSVNFDGSRLGVALNSPSVTSQQAMGLNFSTFDTNEMLVERLSANKDAIQVQTNQYIRWKPFSGRIEQFAKNLYKFYNYEVPIALVQLEYWDRFDLVEAQNQDSSALIASDSPFVSRAGIEHAEPWHSHSGRFERLSDRERRLIQTKVDYGDYPGKTGAPTRSIIIYTMMQDALNAPGYRRTVGMGWGFNEAMAVLDRQHTALKGDLRRIITLEAAERIGL